MAMQTLIFTIVKKIINIALLGFFGPMIGFITDLLFWPYRLLIIDFCFDPTGFISAYSFGPIGSTIDLVFALLASIIDLLFWPYKL